MDTGRIPPFALVLGFEHELRQRVPKRVRDDGLTLMDSLKQAESDYEARELHFTSHLANDRGRGGPSGSTGGDNSNQRGDGGNSSGRNARKRKADKDRRAEDNQYKASANKTNTHRGKRRQPRRWR